MPPENDVPPMTAAAMIAIELVLDAEVGGGRWWRAVWMAALTAHSMPITMYV